MSPGCGPADDCPVTQKTVVPRFSSSGKEYIGLNYSNNLKLQKWTSPQMTVIMQYVNKSNSGPHRVENRRRAKTIDCADHRVKS